MPVHGRWRADADDVGGESMDRTQAMKWLDELSRVPQPEAFGYFASDDHPFGAGTFRWCDSVEQLLEVLIDADPHLYGDAGDLGAALRRGVPDKTSELTEELRSTLNGIAKGAFRIEWWGTFGALCSGEGEFPGRLVQGFLADLEADLDDEWEGEGERIRIDRGGPVPGEHRNAFAESLAEHGF
jgi:hypothetical protein